MLQTNGGKTDGTHLWETYYTWYCSTEASVDRVDNAKYYCSEDKEKVTG